MRDGPGQPHRRLRINLSDLEVAFDTNFEEMTYFLDLETGAVVLVTGETRQTLEEIYEEIPEGADAERAFAAALAARNLQDWEAEEVQQADAVESGFGTRYVKVPPVETRDAYRDMEDFIDTMTNERLRDRLADAIRGRGAFRRFKNVLGYYPAEEQRWFAFRDARMRERILAWLDEERIELIVD